MNLVGEKMKKVLFVASIKDHIVGFHLPFINVFMDVILLCIRKMR